MDNTYAEVGVQVILGKHTYKPWHHRIRNLDLYSDPEMMMIRLNWSPIQEEYVGKKAKITKVFGTADFSGCLCCKVDIDHGRNNWRVESMILASEADLRVHHG